MKTDPQSDRAMEPAKVKTQRVGKTELRARIEKVLYARLSGAELWDLLAISREEGWQVGKRTLQRYAAAADRLIERSLEKDRDKLLRRHLAQRRRLFARAVKDGDVRAALAIAQDEAELMGLYPRKGLEITGAGGAPLAEKLTDAERHTAIQRILARYGFALPDSAESGTGCNSPPGERSAVGDGPILG
jgi:hypothetical protein